MVIRINAAPMRLAAVCAAKAELLAYSGVLTVIGNDWAGRLSHRVVRGPDAVLPAVIVIFFRAIGPMSKNKE